MIWDILFLTISAAAAYQARIAHIMRALFKKWLFITLSVGSGLTGITNIMDRQGIPPELLAVVFLIIIVTALTWPMFKSPISRIFGIVFVFMVAASVIRPHMQAEVAQIAEQGKADIVVQSNSDVNAPFDDTRQTDLIVLVQEVVAKRLKDPDSADFRNMKYYHNSKAKHVICGEVNAKNSFGGYIGFQPFMSGGTLATTYFPDDMKSPKEFKKSWEKYCTE